jgi:cellulose synthase/poly-beta-1,6-N-acetylglucosamine synthase-like glycosyltransferase
MLDAGWAITASRMDTGGGATARDTEPAARRCVDPVGRFASGRTPRRTRMPTVGVIVPVRNEEEQLGRSLEALLANTYPDFDVLVVDDASTDGTAAVALAFASGGHLRVLRNRERLGPTRGSNRASRGPVARQPVPDLEIQHN